MELNTIHQNGGTFQVEGKNYKEKVKILPKGGYSYSNSSISIFGMIFLNLRVYTLSPPIPSDNWTTIAQIVLPKHRPTDTKYLSGIALDLSLTNPIATPVKVLSTGEIQVYLASSKNMVIINTGFFVQ